MWNTSSILKLYLQLFLEGQNFKNLIKQSFFLTYHLKICSFSIFKINGKLFIHITSLSLSKFLLCNKLKKNFNATDKVQYNQKIKYTQLTLTELNFNIMYVIFL